MVLDRREFCLAMAGTLATQRRQRALEQRSYYGGFRVGIQSCCYQNVPLTEAIAKAGALGLKYFEVCPAHADLAKVEVPDLRESRRRWLDAGFSVHTYGVQSFRTKEQRRTMETVFHNAQDAGIPVVVVDADAATMKDIDRLCERYHVRAALHNPPGATPGASIDAIWQILQDRSPRCGAAIHVGNFQSAGQDAAAAIAKFRGRILDVHVSVPAGGTPALHIPDVFTALRAQEYDEVVILDDPGASDDQIAASLDYLKKVTGGK